MRRHLGELRRRGVFRVAALYIVGAWLSLQVADLAFPGLSIPDEAIRYVWIGALAGLPLVLLFGWRYEITAGGVVRTAPRTTGDNATLPLATFDYALLGLLLLVSTSVGILLAREIRDTQRYFGVGAARHDHEVSWTARDSLPSLAVLPFADMSPGRDQEFFSDGMTEEITNTLAKIQGLTVRARTSAFAYKSRNLDLRLVGDSLGVRYLVEGSVRKDGKQLRITAQLIDSEDGSHLWSESYDRPLMNVFEIQREIAEAIAEELRVPLGLEEGEQLVLPTQDLDAYDLYLAGRARMREREIGEAIKLFEAALVRDSSWAPAWAGLAESRALSHFYAQVDTSATTTERRELQGRLWGESLNGAEAAAERALELDPRSASALVALAGVYRDRREWEKADAAYERALRLDPENVEAHQQYAEYLSFVGRKRDEYLAAHRALALDRSPIRLHVVGILAREIGLYEEALQFLEEGIRMDPDGPLAPSLGWNVRFTHLVARNWAAARESYLRHFEQVGRPEWARQLQEIWLEDEPPTEQVAAWFAQQRGGLSAVAIYIFLNDHDRALDILEKHANSVNRVLPYAGLSTLFSLTLDPLRDDPRFQDILDSFGVAGRTPQRFEVHPGIGTRPLPSASPELTAR